MKHRFIGFHSGFVVIPALALIATLSTNDVRGGLRQSDDERQHDGIQKFSEEGIRQRLFTGWMTELKGYRARAFEGLFLAQLAENDDAAQIIFSNHLRNWAARSPDEVVHWLHGYRDALKKKFDIAKRPPEDPELPELEFEINSKMYEAWDAAVEGFSRAEDINLGVLAASNAPRMQDASWSDCFNVLADHWLSERPLADAMIEAQNFPSSLMRDAIYNMICTELIKESPEKAVAWMSKLRGLDRNLLIHLRGVDIYKAWKDKTAAEAWLDSLGEDTAVDIRKNARD